MEVLILAILVGLAVAAVRARDLMASVAILGGYSLMMALLWCHMNALDVGFTEAAVGAGISTVLMLAALGRIGRREVGPTRAPLLRLPLLTMRERLRRARHLGKQHQRSSAWGAILVCALVGAALLYGTRDIPRVGDASSPANRQGSVAAYYVTNAPDEIGPANIVTSVLGDYRGYDTMGETVVIFTAALCVLMLLRQGRVRRRDESDA